MGTKIVTLRVTVRVDDSVEDNEVAQQIGDALDPDGWNWDVSYPDVAASRPELSENWRRLYTRQHGERISLAMHQAAERRASGLYDTED